MYTQEYLQWEGINLSKGIDELKDWAMHNVRLISILPSNKNLQVGTKLSDVLEPNVDEKYFLSEERTSQFLKEFPKELPDGADGFNIKQIGNIDQHKRDRNNPNSGRVYDPSGISPTLSTMQGGGLEPKIILPKEEQSVIIDDTQGFDGTRIYKNIAPTIRSQRSGLKVINNLRIRKLTPLECWRLQGFTDEQFYKAKNDGVSNSQLYKQAGNSVTVNVIDAIARKLL